METSVGQHRVSISHSGRLLEGKVARLDFRVGDKAWRIPRVVRNFSIISFRPADDDHADGGRERYKPSEHHQTERGVRTIYQLFTESITLIKRVRLVLASVDLEVFDKQLRVSMILL